MNFALTVFPAPDSPLMITHCFSESINMLLNISSAMAKMWGALSICVFENRNEPFEKDKKRPPSMIHYRSPILFHMRFATIFDVFVRIHSDEDGTDVGLDVQQRSESRRSNAPASPYVDIVHVETNLQVMRNFRIGVFRHENLFEEHSSGEESFPGDKRTMSSTPARRSRSRLKSYFAPSIVNRSSSLLFLRLNEDEIKHEIYLNDLI